MNNFTRSREITSHEFDLTENDISDLIIKENYNKDKCLVWNKERTICYYSFILIKNSQSKTVCEIKFYKSSATGKYIPRPTFKRLSLSGEEKISKSELAVSIAFNKSESAVVFWKLIAFFNSYKSLVDLGDFNNVFKVIHKDSYIMEFKNKDEQQKIEDLKELMIYADLSATDIKLLTFQSRKKNLEAFLWLLKNKVKDNKDSHTLYREKYLIRGGEEYIWHHFLSRNDWILGLNADIKFILEFLDEQGVGIANSKKQHDPIVDMLGISEFTTLVELKHSNTLIFKKSKTGGRANTWPFTPEFFEAISQCLGQKFELEKSFNLKDFKKDDDSLLDKSKLQTIDPKTVLLVGNKKREFPQKDRNSDNILKNRTLERFRRNNRNIDVLTYDELFERAYQIVFSKRLDENWYWEDESSLFE